jgi:hypothetical protein
VEQSVTVYGVGRKQDQAGDMRLTRRMQCICMHTCILKLCQRMRLQAMIDG